MTDLTAEQRAAALRIGAEALASLIHLPMSNVSRFALLDAARGAEAALRSDPVFRRLSDDGWFEIGEGSHRGQLQLLKAHEQAAHMVLDGRPAEANARVGKMSDCALRKRLKRFAARIERPYPRLATAIRSIEVSRSGVMSAPRAPRIITR